MLGDLSASWSTEGAGGGRCWYWWDGEDGGIVKGDKGLALQLREGEVGEDGDL